MVQPDTAHALCMLDNQGYKHTLRIRHVFFCFYTQKCASEVPHCYVCTKVAYLVIDMNVYEDLYAKTSCR